MNVADFVLIEQIGRLCGNLVRGTNHRARECEYAENNQPRPAPRAIHPDPRLRLWYRRGCWQMLHKKLAATGLRETCLELQRLLGDAIHRLGPGGWVVRGGQCYCVGTGDGACCADWAGGGGAVDCGAWGWSVCEARGGEQAVD